MTSAVSPYIESIAKTFWNKVDKPKYNPPYDIAGAVSLVLPLDIISMSELTLGKIKKWLFDNDIQIPIDVNERDLHGFVLINRGAGFIFINGTDSEEERRYTVAHEASHFILDYQIPRDKSINKFGTTIVDVLDGFREATIEEHVSGLINGIAVCSFTHLLEKDGDGAFANLNILNAENKADMLALQLLAPYSEVITYTLAGKRKVSFDLFDQKCLDILLTKFKIPISIAKQYSKRLAYSVAGEPSIITKLGF